MKACLGILASVLAVQLVYCTNTTENKPQNELLTSLKEQLDWVCIFDQVHKNNKADYKREIEVIIGESKATVYFQDIYTDFDDFITKVLDVRTSLVKNTDCPYNIDYRDVNYIKPRLVLGNLFDFLPSLNGFLLELSTNITEWTKNNATTNVTAEQLKNWIKGKGYTDEDLKEAKLDDVKNKVDLIVGEGKPLHRLMSFYVTWYMLSVPKGIVKELAWLHIFVDTIEGNKAVNDNIVAEVNSLLPSKGEELVAELKKMKSDDSESTTMGPFSMKVWIRGSYALPLGGVYIEKLKEVCDSLKNNLESLQKSINNNSLTLTQGSENQRNAYYVYNQEVIDPKLVEKMQPFLGNSGALTVVCKILEDFDEKKKAKAAQEEQSNLPNDQGALNDAQQPRKAGDGFYFATFNVLAIVVATSVMA